MKIRCEKCGHINVIHASGRKPADLPVTIIYDAIRHSKTYRDAADFILLSKNIEISGSLVHKRIGLEADRLGMSRETLVKKIRDGKINALAR